MSIADEVERLKEAKIKIKLSIEGKGVIVPSEATFTVYPEYIEDIETQGKYQDKGAIPSTEQQVIEPDEGYDALRRVLVEAAPLEEKTVIPSASGSEVLPTGDNIGLSKVTVTGDANLVGSNIKKDTTIFGVTGTFEGGEGDDDYTKLGETVTVQARNSFKKGDIFIGEKNEDATYGLQSEQLSGVTGSPVLISEDLSVVVPAQTVNSTNGFRVFILNGEGSYTRVNVPISEDIDFLISSSRSYAASYNISKDGTHVIGVDAGAPAKGIFTIKINKNAMTADVKHIAVAELGTGINITSGSTTYTDGYVSSVNNYSGKMIGNKFITSVTIKYNEGKSSVSKNVAYHYSSSTNSLSLHTITSMPSSNMSYTNTGFIDENTAIHYFKASLAIARFYKITCGSTVTTEYLFEANYKISGISQNAKYVADNEGSVYELNLSTNSLTKIGQVPECTGNVLPDDTATFILRDSVGNYDIYELSTKELVYDQNSAANRRIVPAGGSYFQIVDGYYLSTNGVTGGAFKSYMGYSDVQYYIRNTQAYIETADRIYGIVPRDMEMEEKGTAQNLFNTFGLETEETETVE